MVTNGSAGSELAARDAVQAAVGLPSFASSEMGADAQADLAAAIIRASVQVNAAGMRELAFIRLYAGRDGEMFVVQLLKDKNHQNPGALKRFVEALKALSLFDHLKGFNLNLGGK